MGAANVRLALAWPGKLPSSTRVVLAAMALAARDRDTGKGPARVYYGGLDALALATGRTPSRTERRATQRHIATLIDVGLVSRMGGGYRARNTEYRLNLPVENE